MKKKFALSEDVLRKEIEKQNLHRGIFMSTDYKVYYELQQAVLEKADVQSIRSGEIWL